MPLAKHLGLSWLPLFKAGTRVNVEDLPTVVDELRRLRNVLADDRSKSPAVERLDFVLERLHEVDNQEVAAIFIG